MAGFAKATGGESRVSAMVLAMLCDPMPALDGSDFRTSYMMRS